jgi:hypothetical protein
MFWCRAGDAMEGERYEGDALLDAGFSCKVLRGVGQGCKVRGM